MIGEDGKEYPNPNPLFVDVGPKRLSLQDQIKRILHSELSREAYDQGFETFEESQDFDVPDEDPEPLSGFEVEEMVPETVEQELPTEPLPAPEEPTETPEVEEPVTPEPAKTEGE